MPFRLIGTIILLILVTIFAGVNLDNKCDITFIFYTFEKVPVFMTVIVSFAIGVLLMMPFTLGRKKKKNQKPVVQPQPKTDDEGSKTLFDFKIKREASEQDKSDKSKAEKKSFFSKDKKSKKSDNEKTADSAKKESGEAKVSDTNTAASTADSNSVSETTPSESNA